MNQQQEPIPIVIDGRQAAKVARQAAERPGLDFPLARGRVVRLPYPAWRYFPAGLDPSDPKNPHKVRVERRFGYPRPIETLVERFRSTVGSSDDERQIFAAAVVVAWALMSWPGWTGKPAATVEPNDLFDMDSEDALVFIHRLLRLTAGQVDLDQDDQGHYLIPLANVDEPASATLDEDQDH